jgi:hypothetical protein
MSIKESIFRYIAGFVYLVLGLIVIFSIFLGIYIYNSPACREKEALDKAELITNEEWSIIYNEAVVLLGDGLESRYELTSLPENIASLEPVGVTSHGSSLWVYLAACGLDSKVIVMVKTSENFDQGIHIQWGDPVESRDLWTKPNKNM